MTVLCDLWFPIAWSKQHPTQPVPYHVWLCWHFANLLPKDVA